MVATSFAFARTNVAHAPCAGELLRLGVAHMQLPYVSMPRTQTARICLPNVENAHAVLASSCDLKTPELRL